jgi:hypothetical protein
MGAKEFLQGLDRELGEGPPEHAWHPPRNACAALQSRRKVRGDQSRGRTVRAYTTAPQFVKFVLFPNVTHPARTSGGARRPQANALTSIHGSVMASLVMSPPLCSRLASKISRASTVLKVTSTRGNSACALSLRCTFQRSPWSALSPNRSAFCHPSGFSRAPRRYRVRGLRKTN